MSGDKPILLTMGEPAGIGAEITLKSWQALRGNPDNCFAVLHDAEFLKKIDKNIPITVISNPNDAATAFSNSLPVLSTPLGHSSDFGKPNPAHTPAIMRSIAEAVKFCQQGVARAMVTNPIHKANMQQGGFEFPGHTEYLAHLCGNKSKPLMMLVNPQLRVIPITVHMALKDVSAHLTQDKIHYAANIAHQALKRFFGLKSPRLVITGLNPHAGEDGAFGMEEQNIIAPAVAELRKQGITITGPLSADTLFFDQARQQYDLALCQYHDQALIPVKAIDFWNSVNVTLGLDIIRTSPDHGTALDIAGRNIARPDSMIAAIKLAAEMAGNHG